MRELKFNKEPNLTGKMAVETHYAVYFLPTNQEKSIPQKIAECTEDGIAETLDNVISRLEKNGFAVEKNGADDEFTVSGNMGGTDIVGELYAGSYMIVVNSPQRKAMERAFKIVRKPPQNNNRNNNRNNGNRRGNNNGGYRR